MFGLSNQNRTAYRPGTSENKGHLEDCFTFRNTIIRPDIRPDSKGIKIGTDACHLGFGQVCCPRSHNIFPVGTALTGGGDHSCVGIHIACVTCKTCVALRGIEGDYNLALISWEYRIGSDNLGNRFCLPENKNNSEELKNRFHSGVVILSYQR